jgi:hypothetical protein
MTSEEMQSLAQEYVQVERRKDFEPDCRVMLAFMAGMTKGHMICAQNVTEQILDMKKASK